MTDNRHMPHTNKPYSWRLGRGTSENLTWEAIKKTWRVQSNVNDVNYREIVSRESQWVWCQ